MPMMLHPARKRREVKKRKSFFIGRTKILFKLYRSIGFYFVPAGLYSLGAWFFYPYFVPTGHFKSDILGAGFKIQSRRDEIKVTDLCKSFFVRIELLNLIDAQDL